MSIPINSVIHGDCLDVMKQIPDKSIDMVLCDLPYGTTAITWDVNISLCDLWKQYKRIIKDNGVFVLTASQPFTTDLINSNRDWFKYNWVWDKISGANFMNLKNRPWKTHEDVLIFSYSANFTFNPIFCMRTHSSLKRDPANKPNRVLKTSGSNAQHYGLTHSHQHKLKLSGEKHPIDIIKFSAQVSERYKIKHPTRKPVELFEYLIKTYTNEGETVLDNCAGSGTTAIACRNLNRNYILIEKEQKYIDIINKRIKDHVVQPELNLEMLKEEVS